MSKKSVESSKSKSLIHPPIHHNPEECPYREFKDSELGIQDLWGVGTSGYRTFLNSVTKAPIKQAADYVWIDEQTQPVPRSVRVLLDGWVRAEELASIWEADVVIFEEDGAKMSVLGTQLNYSQVLTRSSFCRELMSVCYILERIESFVVEHQWENFTCTVGPEGWRAKYHIYSPGMKAGGGTQHRPSLSKNGCYLVRLFYLGAWRSVWVSDQVPVDAENSPLLLFSPQIVNTPAPVKPTPKQAPPAPPTVIVVLWPLLLCKALLKLAAPDMTSDPESDTENSNLEDEEMSEFNMIHALTGSLNLTLDISGKTDPDSIWDILKTEVPAFQWEDDDETLTSTVKTKSTKKALNKEPAAIKRNTLATIDIADTKHLPPHTLPGITPCHETELVVTMVRDVPMKKPLPEPEVPLWKTYRWVDWARNHGLYDDFSCPRTRFLKVSGLLKLSYAPHLLDVQSTESIIIGFRQEQSKHGQQKTKGGKDIKAVEPNNPNNSIQPPKEDMKEWILFDNIFDVIKSISVLAYPSMFQFTSAASSPPARVTKTPMNRALDVPQPKNSPLYLQIDWPNKMNLRIALAMLHPRVLVNSGVPVIDYIEPAYVFLEELEWFKDCALPAPKTFVQTRGYNSTEVEFEPGRHICRLWVHSRMSWHVMLLSEANLLLGPRDMILSATVRECPWAAIFLSNLGASFMNWIKINRTAPNVAIVDRDFFKSYQPDLKWDPYVAGYDISHTHWMFRRALESFLIKRLGVTDLRSVCAVLRNKFLDPDFGLPEKPVPQFSLRQLAKLDPCDCTMPEEKELGEEEEVDEASRACDDEKSLVSKEIMDQLLTPPKPPIVSQICEFATEELPCGVLKEERDKMIKKHETATFLQSRWRGAWARKCLRTPVPVTPDVLKLLTDNAFGNLESLSALMTEFFKLFPGAKYAYSVGSALSGVYGLKQHTGVSKMTPKSTWIPYFQAVFRCHKPVKVHFDLQSSLPRGIFSVYNNDTGTKVPQVFNTHITFDFEPNKLGFTVMAHGRLDEPAGNYADVHWMLTVLSSTDYVFHICDNQLADFCVELPLMSSTKLHVTEMFLPNRRNILGGIQVSILRDETISFRALASSPELEIIAVLKTRSPDGDFIELDRCPGKGEIFWPFIRIKGEPPNISKITQSQITLKGVHESSKEKAHKQSKLPKPGSAKIKSNQKLKDKMGPEIKQYFIEVIAPSGWPLSLAQWIRIEEARRIFESKLAFPVKPSKSAPKDVRVSSARDKDKDKDKIEEESLVPPPLPDDAFIDMECAYSIAGAAVARRDDERDQEFAAAVKSWEELENGRSARGAKIRQDFRDDYLVVPVQPSETLTSVQELGAEEMEKEELKETQQGPTPAATENGEEEIEVEEERMYLTKPDQLKDNFVPLPFVPECMKDLTEEFVLLTPDKVEAAKQERQARLEAALQRMADLQTYNEIHVLGRQKNRCMMLEKFYNDSRWSDELTQALEERDDAIAREALARNLSMLKKKAETVKKK